MTDRKKPEKLKPCPFCGARAKYEPVSNGWGWAESNAGFIVKCTEEPGCGVATPDVFDTRPQAKEWWNRRAND